MNQKLDKSEVGPVITNAAEDFEIDAGIRPGFRDAESSTAA